MLKMVFLRGTLTNPLMPSVQRGPIDFSGDGLVGNITPVRYVVYNNNRFSMTYDGGYLLTFFYTSPNFFFSRGLFFSLFFLIFYRFLTPPDPPKSAPKRGVRGDRKKKFKKGSILTLSLIHISEPTRPY